MVDVATADPGPLADDMGGSSVPVSSLAITVFDNLVEQCVGVIDVRQGH